MKIRKLIIAIAFIALLLPQCIVRAESNDESGIEEFIMKLYEAREEGNEELLLSMGAGEVEIMTNRALLESGLQGFHNFQIYSYQCSENSWVVAVGYEIEAAGVDVWMPAMETGYVIKNELGQFMRPREEELSSMISKYTELAMADPELIEMYQTYEDAYMQILQNDITGEVQDFNEKLREAYDRQVEGYVARYNSQNDKALKNQTDKYYTVRQGDCLWSISEEYLESGDNWSLLYEKNREIIGESPDLIFPGQQLRLEIDVR